MKKILAFACLVLSLQLAYADQGGFFNSGGSLAGGTPVSNPSGTLTISGATLTFLTTDGRTAVNGTFSTSSTVESCSGGGKGGHVTCSYTFTGLFSGALTVNGAVQAINGATWQVYGTNNVVIAGATAYNSAYTPFYFSNTGQILRSDDLLGTNLISYGTQGSGKGQFYGAYGIALDSAGRIYVSDTYNSRVVRIDDMNGTNWATFGAYGSGTGQFNEPTAISVDSLGRIYVMDTNNSRLVRIDDMIGTNWTTMTGLGSGVGQFAQYGSPVAFDASGRIYVADTGNERIVRMDDMNGTNWTTLTQSPVINGYTFRFATPLGVALDASGRIYVVDALPMAVIRVDDITGANWTSMALAAGATPHGITVDSSGMVLVGGGGAQLVDNMAGVLASGNALTPYFGPYYVFGATLIPMPSPRPSAIRFTPPTLAFSQNVGTTSAPQTITITNFGGSPLNGLTVSTARPFFETNNCPTFLAAGSSCSASVTFTPSASGATTGALRANDDSGNMGPTQVLKLTGTGTTPAVSFTPASVLFQFQVVGTTSKARNITVKSTGTGPLQITNIATAAPFSQTNNCIGSYAPATSCTIEVTFTPSALGAAKGSLTITDNAGTQTVAVSGQGGPPASVTTNSISFGTVAVGTTSAAKTVGFSNYLSAPLTFTSIATTGPFTLATNTCGLEVAAHKSCKVSVTFSPTVTGRVSGTLTFTDSTWNSPQTVSLSGTGQ